MKKLLDRALSSFRRGQTAQIFSSDMPARPVCQGCADNLPSYKIGSYVYHKEATHSTSICSTTDWEVRIKLRQAEDEADRNT